MIGASAIATPDLGRERAPWDRAFLFMLALILCGYAIFGRGFAYLGVAPLFIGEVVLGIGMLALVSGRQRLQAIRTAPGTFLMLFMVIGLARTLADLPAWGGMALRDAVVWGYGLFAIVVSTVLLRNLDRIRTLVERYRRFVPLYILLAGSLYLVARVLGDGMPRLPGSKAAIVEAKGGDMLVHLAGVTAFLLVGLARWRTWILALLLADFGLLAITNRGGMLAFMAGIGFLVLFRSRRVRLAPGLYAGALAIVVVLLVDPQIEIPGGRTVSVDQLTENIASIAGSSESKALEGTKEWRLNWWGQIVGYTFGGRHFLTGKGFGINLATDDGFQVTDDESLRSPHNGHMTILARMGVPGFLLWIAALGSWFIAAFRCMLDARRRHDDAWHGIFLFLMAYFIAALVNASFDVYLEGPMGGIWFWCLYGIGLAAIVAYRKLGESVGGAYA
jgi:hypothetical protein